MYHELQKEIRTARCAIQKIEKIINAGGISGKSAYQIAVDNGFEGTEQEWLASLGNITPELEALLAQATDLYTFNSNLDINTITIIPGKKIGDFIGLSLSEIIESILTVSSVPPVNNSFPYTLPFTLL